MPGRICGVLFLVAASLCAQESIPQCMKEGDAAYLKGDYEAARGAFERAWGLAQATAAENPQRYEILKRLTSVRGAAGEFADADTWLQQAVTWRESTLGERDPKIVDDLLISVGLCRRMKDMDRALAILRRVQGLHVALYGSDSVQVADDFSRAAQLYGEQKQLEEAIRALNTAVLIRTKLGGPLDPALIPDLDRLGEYQTVQRAYEEAEAAYRHVLVIRETLYGKVNADLIATVDGLAYALFGQKRYDEAEPVYQRLLSLWEASVGKDHPMVAVALDKIAVFESAQKKYAEVHEAQERSTAIRAKFHGLGISQQATQAFLEGHANDARGFYQRGLAVLDPPNPVYDELRDQFSEILTTLGGPQGKSQAPAPKKSAPAKKAGKL
uniref:Tetratricopeptide domain protein n=1 Tax=Solibacter usitatus (strain Ellin6076) TaxID=234267 RepID=Q025P6_SOLUE